MTVSSAFLYLFFELLIKHELFIFSADLLDVTCKSFFFLQVNLEILLIQPPSKKKNTRHFCYRCGISIIDTSNGGDVGSAVTEHYIDCVMFEKPQKRRGCIIQWVILTVSISKGLIITVATVPQSLYLSISYKDTNHDIDSDDANWCDKL
jgi:hypothetical protein